MCVGVGRTTNRRQKEPFCTAGTGAQPMNSIPSAWIRSAKLRFYQECYLNTSGERFLLLCELLSSLQCQIKNNVSVGERMT